MTNTAVGVPLADREYQREAHKALDRMRRAEQRGTGCHLTADMIQSLSLTSIGQIWAEDNPFATPVHEVQ